MTIRKHANNISTTLNGAITNVATSLTLTSATGLPAIGAGETYRLTITSGASIEIVEVTDDASTPTLTVTRAMEGTTGTAFSSGATVQLRVTGNSLDRKQDQVATATEVIDFGSATSFEIPNAAAPTLSAVGQIALDTTVTDYTDGLLTYYSGTSEYACIAIQKSALVTPTDAYVVTYDATTDKFKLAAAGGGGGSVTGPVSSTANGLVLFDGTGGSTLKDAASTDGLIRGMTIGRGAGNISTTTAFGVTAGGTATSGESVFVGYQAGLVATSALQSTYIGSQAGKAVTTSAQSVLIGYQAAATLTTGAQNVIVGTLAGSAMGINRNDNVLVGFSAGTKINGSSNIFIGTYAGNGSAAYTTANSVAIGYNIFSNTTASTTGSSLTMIGAASCLAITTATNLCSYGYGSCAALTTAGNVSAYGHNSLSSLTTGVNNTGVGVGVGIAGATGAVALTTGEGNTLVGSRAGTSALDCANAIALGRDAVATKATGATSSDFGPGLSIGSAAYPVGFRGDGSIIPCALGANGFLKSKVNGTQYYIPLVTDASTTMPKAQPWTEVTGTSQSAALGNGYIANNAALVTITLPATAAVGDIVSVVGKGAGLWKVTANTGQTVKVGTSTTSSAGSVAAANQYDTIDVICITANTTWVTRSSVTTGFTIT